MSGSRGTFSLSLLATAAGVAIGGVIATSFALLLHEVAGHGLAAYALGGRFLGFFVSPTTAFADIATSDAARPWALAAGALVNLTTGLLAYAVLRRQQRPSMAGIALWHYARVSIVFQLMYVGALPLGMWLFSQAPQGDWVHVLAAVGIHPLVSAAVFVPLAVFAAARFAGLSVRLTPWRGVVQRRWGIVAAYASLVSPPLLLALAYALVTLPWSDGRRDHFELVGLIATPLTAGLAGAVVAQSRRGVAADHLDREVRPSGAGIFPATAVLLMTAVLALVGWLCGPTTVLRRGVAVQRPAPDDYFRAAHDVRVTVTFEDGGRAALLLSSEPVTTRGSPYVRRFSQAVATVGPSSRAAAEFTELFTEYNLGLGRTSLRAAPRRSERGWDWSAIADVGSDPIRVRIWPMIYSAHARVVSLSLAGVAPLADAARVEGVTTTDGTIVWSRPATFVAPVQFDVTVGAGGR